MLVVPIARKVSVAVALESLVSVRLETSSHVSSLLQVKKYIENCFHMRFSWVG
jgi:hypothetical protein